MRNIFAANRTAIYFIIGYFVANFSYAWLYLEMCPDGFYANYTHYEQSWKNETSRMQPVVASMFNAWRIIQEDSAPSNSDKNPLRGAKDFEVTNLRVVDGTNLAFDLSYTIQAPLWKMSPEQLPPGWSVGDITFMQEAVSLVASFQREPGFRSDFEDKKCSKYVLVTATMDDLLKSWKGSTRRACVTKEQVIAIDDYISEYNGVSINI